MSSFQPTPTAPPTFDTLMKAYCASLVTNFFFYPYRDYVKIYVARWPPEFPQPSFVVYRYRGFAENPLQLLLISGMTASLYGGFVGGGGAASGAVLGGVLHGTTKSALRMLGTRMTATKRNGEARFLSITDCVRIMTQERGAWSWFCGSSANILISMSWHGAALASLESRDRRRPSFFSDWWDAFRTHAFLNFVTCPIRNTFRSSVSAVERSGGVRSASEFFSGEAAVFREAGAVAPAMLKTVGLPFFLQGCVRTTFKASIPFGFTYALYRTVGGVLDGNTHRRFPRASY